MHPASQTARLAAGSSDRIRFIRRSDSSSASPEPSGVAPPTIEVLPPWGTSGTPSPAQSRTISTTSSRVAGDSRAAAAP